MRLPLSSRNPAAARLAAMLARFAVTEVTLLVTGETGTGKSLVARRVHALSRPGEPLVIVDCGALAPTLIAAELFGHRSGAFTDATRARAGVLERAGGGTLVLDRVDLLPVEAQTALLRVLDERRFVPVGAATAKPFRARVIALVGPEIDERMRDGRFRPDLFHRLAGFRAELPPLRERPEDILPTARERVRRLGRSQKRALRLGDEAATLLVAYPWPGNFRELEAVVARSVLVAREEEIGAADLGIAAAEWSPVAELAAARGLTLAEAGRLYALWVLAREDGNVSRAARRLGVSRRTLIRWRC